ncbi:MAG: glycosyltransferase family 4 protein [Chloroflexota bacterium]
MHILLVADGRSPITLRWLESLHALGHTLSLISTFPCPPPAGLAHFEVVSVAFSALAGGMASPTRPNGGGGAVPSKRRWVAGLRRILLPLRYRLAPLTLPGAVRRCRQVMKELQPDLVHALRIPFEGILACAAVGQVPLAVSIWGNDLTLHAAATPRMAGWTRAVLQRADGIHADAARDLRLARGWGFPADRPTLLIPTSGGIDLRKMEQSLQPLPAELEARIPPHRAMIINPRGVRAYTCTAAFFQSLPLILQRNPQCVIVCPAMQGEREAEGWKQRLNLDERVVLLPPLPQAQLWGLFARSAVSVSVTSHDGTPNTLLEAMACGSFPVAGDLESLREWITPGVNGLLVESYKADAIAAAVLMALDDEDLRRRAAELNRQIIAERAEVTLMRPRLEAFYRQIVSESGG